MTPDLKTRPGDMEAKINAMIKARRRSEEIPEAIERMQMLAKRLENESGRARSLQRDFDADMATQLHEGRTGLAIANRILSAQFEARANAMDEIARWLGFDLVTLGYFRPGKQQATPYSDERRFSEKGTD